ncbi:MAG: S8 family serine peptidase [Saprospiraceae bacterium]|nr:S8 family serine peptidase [Saprospiraceae bacterium]
MKFNFYLIILTFLTNSLYSQNSILAHRYTVSLKPGVTSFKESNTSSRNSVIKNIEYLNSYQNILSISFHDDLNPEEESQYLKKHPDILNFQAVVNFKQRGCNPNDSAYLAQYNMELMKFDEIWCYATSGLSPFGDTIVVGAIDNGFSYWLTDMIPNIYANRLEIPDNGKDDDLNGYRDDYYGLNAKISSEGDNHQGDTHGTEVISVIGAKGNNRVGISGTNQNIKILLCSANSSDELVKCYHYFVKMKRDYLNSGGKKGAFIVSSNLSAGFDAFPDDLPLVCQAYDSLGSVGILNAVATVNENENIDIVGDVPGLCPSSSLIVVTNTNRSDQKVTDAGYSKVNVDLGACGEGIPMLDISGNIREESGCSFSSPHVAGAISLLYQFCPILTTLNKTKPQSAVSVLHDILLNCGDPLSSLKDVTKSGNRLNIYKALVCLNNYCQDSITDKRPVVLYNNFGSGPVKLKFTPEQFGKYNLFIYNNLGQFIQKQEINYTPDEDYYFLIDINSWPSGVYHVYIEGLDLKWGESLIKI